MGRPTPITAALLYAAASVLVPGPVSAQESAKPALPSTVSSTSGSPWPDTLKPGKPAPTHKAEPTHKPASASKTTPAKPAAKAAAPAAKPADGAPAAAANAPLPPVREPAARTAEDKKPAKAAAKKGAPAAARATAAQPDGKARTAEPAPAADSSAAAGQDTAKPAAEQAKEGVATARMARWEAKARRRAQRRAAAEAAASQEQADAGAAAPVVQASAAPQASSGGFDIVKFLSGQPQQSQAAPAAAAAPEELPEQGRRGRWHNRDSDRAARAAVADLIAKHARSYGIPVGLADAVVRVESRYNPNARNGPYVGLCQIHPATARSVGYTGSVSGLYDADTNLRYGLKYLAMAYQLADGDTCRTILKYQAGHRAISMTRAAAQYCARVRTMMASH